MYWVRGTGGLVHALSAKRGMKEEVELRTLDPGGTWVRVHPSIPVGLGSDRLHPRVPVELEDASQPRSMSPGGLIDFPGAL